ncbi:MAG: cation:proton antiporter [Planctomycetes bacterium]|nr:cation:proton antiporter [Planctomycetota bacterium]
MGRGPIVHDFPLLTTIAAAFAAAWVLGILTHKLGLSPIVGYLLAGILIGPHTPGFVGDVRGATQLAELGVILLMFGVGLHFRFKDLMAVRAIAIPGAIGQSAVATIAGLLVFTAFGLSASAGLVLGVALAVASTVVLMRVLEDARLLDGPAGHVAVGWLIVEDVITVIVLVLIPALGGAGDGDALGSLLWALVKLAALVALVAVAGSRLVPKALVLAARLRSRELFTLTVLVVSIAVATGAAVVFGASVALGAFLAGMVVAQSPVSKQAAADVLPLRDAFAVLFFVSVGMLFDPAVLIEEPGMLAAGLAIVLLVKPLTALVLVAWLGHAPRTALTVAIGLAQIGEFSFIVGDVARKVSILPDSAHDVLVACALVSITLNPLWMRGLERIERGLSKRPWLWRSLSQRYERKQAGVNPAVAPIELENADEALAIVVGYGPVGQHVQRLLRESGLRTVVVDLNMDTVARLRARGEAAIFGDASQAAILDAAGVRHASHLVLTTPDSVRRAEVAGQARALNPRLQVLVRVRYLRDVAVLRQFGLRAAAIDEGEAAIALARRVLIDTGADVDRIHDELARIRKEFDDAT